MNELRVAHVLGELRPSGAEVMLRCASGRWRDQGVTPSIIAWGLEAGPFAEELNDAGYAVNHVRFRRSIASVLDVLRQVRHLRPDLLHVHTERMSFWLLLAARLRFPRVELVRTVHNAFPFSGRLRVVRAVQRQMLRRLGVRFVSISPTVQENERKRFGLRTHLVWNWVDIDRLRLPGSEVPAIPARRIPRVVMIGNCSPWKRHDLGIRSFARGVNQVARLVHAGIEESETYPERSLVESLSIASDVDFLGSVDGCALLGEADLLLMPSEREGLGMVVGEAICAGVPVVASNAPGSRDYRWSTLVHLVPGDVDSLAAAMLQALATPSEAHVRRALALEARDRLAPERGVSEYLTIYRTAARRGRRRSASRIVRACRHWLDSDLRQRDVIREREEEATVR